MSIEVFKSLYKQLIFRILWFFEIGKKKGTDQEGNKSYRESNNSGTPSRPERGNKSSEQGLDCDSDSSVASPSLDRVERIKKGLKRALSNPQDKSNSETMAGGSGSRDNDGALPAKKIANEIVSKFDLEKWIKDNPNILKFDKALVDKVIIGGKKFNDLLKRERMIVLDLINSGTVITNDDKRNFVSIDGVLVRVHGTPRGNELTKKRFSALMHRLNYLRKADEQVVSSIIANVEFPQRMEESKALAGVGIEFNAGAFKAKEVLLAYGFTLDFLSYTRNPLNKKKAVSKIAFLDMQDQHNVYKAIIRQMDEEPSTAEKQLAVEMFVNQINTDVPSQIDKRVRASLYYILNQ